MDKIINIAGDCHNFDSLKKLIYNYENLILLGDIGATVEKKEFYNNMNNYGKAWKAFAKQDFSEISEETKKWFEKINIHGWIKQLDQIKDSQKSLIINMGNADLAMISFFPECAEYLKEIEKQVKLEMIKKPFIKIFENIQIFFLPYSHEAYEIKNIIPFIDKNKPLFILAHCPAFKFSKKPYYMNHYKVLESISKVYNNKLYYIHGHMHPNKSYIYYKNELPNVVFLTPKSDENSESINVNQDIIQINSINGSIQLLDTNTNKYIEFEKLPEEYNVKEDHWNDFE
jgi:hypothetical protein